MHFKSLHFHSFIHSQRMSYGVCPDVRAGLSELFYVVLCTAHLDEQFVEFSVLGFVTLGPFHCA